MNEEVIPDVALRNPMDPSAHDQKYLSLTPA